MKMSLVLFKGTPEFDSISLMPFRTQKR